MEDKIVHKFITKFKDKLSKNKTAYPTVEEYAFSSEEIDDISRKNKEKIQELKQDVFSSKKRNLGSGRDGLIMPIYGTSLGLENLDEKSSEEVLEDEKKAEEKADVLEEKYNLEGNEEIKEETLNEEVIIEDEPTTKEEVLEEENLLEEKVDLEERPQNSFIHLNLEYQKIVMGKWREIDSTQIDKDIIEGKDLLNHNYTITYADDAARFIHDIRKRYEIVICYLIGFNNEKKGIFDKTIFSSRIDDEWKYLSNYIKVLEKIRSFRKLG